MPERGGTGGRSPERGATTGPVPERGGTSGSSPERGGTAGAVVVDEYEGRADPDRSVAGSGGGGGPTPGPRRTAGLPTWVKGVTPLILLAVLLAVFLQSDPTAVLREAFPPVEELTIERITLPEPGVMRIHVVNGGPEAVTVAQVLVDDAVWAHALDGDRTIDRLGRRTLTLPYPWVEGEFHEIALLTSTGLTFHAEVPVAVQTPTPDARYFGIFTLLGVYVGLIPVLLGLLWLPFLRDIPTRWLDFFLSLTIGLLVFLGVDAFAESLEVAEAVPGAYQGQGLVVIGFLGTLLVLSGVGGWRRSRSDVASPLFLAFLVALGIGLHNFGEGLVIGAAYATGEIALGAFLVIGFLLHNTTEGLAIVAPIARTRPRLLHLVGLGALAGLPTIVGAWTGGFVYSPTWTTLFFAIGAGAVAQVVFELWRMFEAREPRSLSKPLNAMGLLAGLLIMYATGIFVAV